MQTLIIDNYDSYTFNLYQMIAKVNGNYPLVIRNDELNWQELKSLKIDNIVISPGPGSPENPGDFGICQQVIENANVPLLGVCLGHQGIAYFNGGKIIHAPEVWHGRISQVYHSDSDLFQDIPSPFNAVRYHSLLVADELPHCLEKIAWTDDGLIMGLRHRFLPVWSVQFHPESICSDYGLRLLDNFKNLSFQYLDSVDNSYVPNFKIPEITINKNKQAEKQEEFNLYTRKLDFCPDTEQIFVNLFTQSENCFWLDSSCVEFERSRFSFLGDGNGVNSLLVHYLSQGQELIIKSSEGVNVCHQSIFDFLKIELEKRRCESEDLPFDFNCGFVGYFGYELKGECGGNFVHNSPLPDAMFLLADRLIVVDHQDGCVYLLQLVKKEDVENVNVWFDEIEKQLLNLPDIPPLLSQEQGKKIKFSLHRDYETYIHDIHDCLQEIHEGESYQVCLTNQLHTDFTPDPLLFYRHLRRINPAPYSAFLRFGEIAIACSSPERFLQIDRRGWVETKPIKGTIKRGKTEQEDLILRQQLQNNEKDRSENLMIVDLLRNDLGRVCEVGSVHVPKLMDVESYATVHQLVTTIRGHLPTNLHAVDCIRAAFPGGSMTGAPKIRTMEIIDKLEQEARGVYSGAIGFLGLNGAADFNIVIRTAVFTPAGTSIGVGGGIVALSDPKMEFEEILLKAQALVQAMELTMQGTVISKSNDITDIPLK
jgi:para-aminobenzoate synthetase